MDSFVTRLAWNTKKWQKPTGEAYRLEYGTYVSDNHFGHEEWLNWKKLVKNGWQYGFLQGVNRSLKRLEGKTIHIRLFTISPEMKRFYVGHIHNALVLSKKEAGEAVRYFTQKGLIKTMGKDVRAVGGSSASLTGLRSFPQGLFNVMFKPVHLKIYDSMVAAERSDRIRKLTRYMLYRAGPKLVTEWDRRTGRAGTRKPKPGGKQKRSGSDPHEADLLHDEMQNQIYGVLSKQFGQRNVIKEEDYIDISVRTKQRHILIEVKNANPRRAVRAAIGQLLEYALFHSRREVIPELMVVGPDMITGKVRDYLGRLKRHFGLDVLYRQYVPGSHRFSV